MTKLRYDRSITRKRKPYAMPICEIIDRSGTSCIKFEAFRSGRPNLPADTIPMWIADIDFAVRSRFSTPCTGGLTAAFSATAA